MRIHALPMPWGDSPENLYATDGPREPIDMQVDGVRYVVVPIDAVGLTTGRRCFWVECRNCRLVIHGGTTGPRSRIEAHHAEAHHVERHLESKSSHR